MTPKAGPQIGVGIDIERVDRFSENISSSDRFFSKTFTRRERAYCMSKANPPMHFAGTFAAKEAAVKALRNYSSGRLAITDFEVSHGRNGEPRVRYTGAETKIKAVEVTVSVSHTTDNAVATAVAVLRRLPT
jgi:holo-[acyl-carrier protein] synthase